MTNYHVGCGLFSIYAGTLNKDGTKWVNKTDVKEEALNAVAQYLLENNKEMRFSHSGKNYVLSVSELSRGED